MKECTFLKRNVQWYNNLPHHQNSCHLGKSFGRRTHLRPNEKLLSLLFPPHLIQPTSFPVIKKERQGCSDAQKSCGVLSVIIPLVSMKHWRPTDCWKLLQTVYRHTCGKRNSTNFSSWWTNFEPEVSFMDVYISQLVLRLCSLFRGSSTFISSTALC